MSFLVVPQWSNRAFFGNQLIYILFCFCPRYHEEEYWSCLHHTFLKPVVIKMGGLDAQVGVGGKNFSVGK